MGSELIQDMNALLNVLTQGEEQTSQLESNLNQSNTPTTLSKSIAQQLHSTLNKAISMAKLIIDSESSRKPPCPNSTASDSPRSTGGSPGSENSGRAFKELKFREMSKKRKALPKWSTKVRVSSGETIEGTPDDGYSWRKYGQKDILGAKFPSRGYYRCTHRNAQGCFATKQVQRSDEDPSIFDISYRGAHTCLQKPRPITSTQSPEELSMQLIHSNPPIPSDHKEGQTHPDHQLPLSFKKGLQVKTEGLSQDDRTTEMDGSLASSFSPAFFSSATSDSNYCPLPPFHVNSSYGGGANDLTELNSAVIASASTSSSMVDIDNYMMGFEEYEPYLSFDGSSFFR
ncbi:uncharacterized protein [Typha angustifolia]|uniref:uncharacterized protein isoform X1 n=1 Tax=Typha angustifolia TaxID=59011 RepID=UPI003C305C48